MSFPTHTYPSGGEFLDKQPPTLTREALRARGVTVLGYYDILQNGDGEILFSVRQKPAFARKAENPRLFYDGGPHAILLKNRDAALVCDYVHPGMRETLRGVKTVLFCETEDAEASGPEGPAITEEYVAEVVFQQGVEELADEYAREKPQA